MAQPKNIVWHDATITKADREKLNWHKSAVLWFTGLSGAGKSTIANAVEAQLYALGARSYLLDGDNIRSGLNNNLGFSADDRKENIRRIGEVAKLFVDSNAIVLTSFISPYISDRQEVRELVEDNEFFEIYVKCSLDECEKRDPKGLYQKARAGEIKTFTGIDAPYEPPESPELILDTEKETVEASAERVINLLKERLVI
ncbi:adenylylsulfate kinase [Scopulibacillus darangshiensis]|uniref:Adenylyl-sulfate kinase n=1 Tax=Scopulibacillus darangshiensis TaxID=442528 RepID=A0A4R2NPU3_9BACL|nr:adenylyl-sulfate kinase [Scopulibacillus darangshiensis]TCP23461.1 adenylylsulfate kinase [Scopulibacillus darangshiensis]